MKEFLLNNSDYLKGMGVNVASIGISFTDLDNIIKLLTLCLGLIYTIWKFYIDWKRSNRRGY